MEPLLFDVFLLTTIAYLVSQDQHLNIIQEKLYKPNRLFCNYFLEKSTFQNIWGQIWIFNPKTLLSFWLIWICQTFDVKIEVEVKLKTLKLLHCNKSFGNEKQKLKEYFMEYVHLVPRKQLQL